VLVFLDWFGLRMQVTKGACNGTLMWFAFYFALLNWFRALRVQSGSGVRGFLDWIGL
jgi:hypothetical protein